MKKLITSILLLSSLGLFAQEVTIPDAEFLNALTSLGSQPGNQKVDTNGDGKIQVSEAEAVVELLYLSDWKEITDLTGIGAFTNLKLLVCSQTNLASLDVSMLPNLEEVVLINNELASLKVHPNLQKITCSDNAPLTGTLDLSQNTNLNYLVTRNTNLDVICLPSLTMATNNPNSFVKDATTDWSDECVQECIVEIPDANFKNALVNYSPTIDTNNDGEIQCEEAEAYSGSLIIRSKGISDLTGIGAFTNIIKIDCTDNPLENIDLSGNINLETFYCWLTPLKEINLSKNINLTDLSCVANQLKNIDISKNINLTKFSCTSNQLENIDISKNINLIEFSCSNNQLDTLDVTKNTQLTRFACSNNLLTSLDLTKNTQLIRVICTNNLLTSLDLVKNTALKQLNCSNNNITSLNVSKNIDLKSVFVGGNPLTKDEIVQQRIQQQEYTIDFSNNPLLDSLDISNTGITSLDLTNNINLTYIKCDSTDNLTTIYVPSVTDAETSINFIKDEDDVWTERVLSVFENEETTHKHIIKAYNLQGMEVPVKTKGQMIILLYSDGTTQKVFGD